MSYDTTQDDLESVFSEVGQVVEIFLPADRNTGRPRGFAFVELSEETAAAAAIEKFDGYEFKGRSLRVGEAEERRRRSPVFSDTGPSSKPRGPRGSKSKGSRRNLRGRKRGF